MSGTPNQATGPNPPTPRDVVAILALVLALPLLIVGLRASPPGPRAIPPLVVDPNTAPPGVLAALPGIGPARLAALEDARRDRPFTSLSDLERRVRGIGPARLAALRPYLRIEASDAR